MTKKTKRLGLGRVFLIGMMCALVCCSDDGGGCGTGGPCQHPWNTKPGSCAISDAQAVGTVGGLCHSTFSASGSQCDPGARCDDQVCIPCGTAGMTCCDPGPDGPEAAKCPDGSTCGQGGDFGICDATCGTLTPGKDNCCDGNSCPGNSCLVNTGKCIAATSGLCADPTLPITEVTFLDSNKCATTTVPIHAHNPAELQTCINEINMAKGWTNCMPGDLMMTAHFCGSTPMFPDPHTSSGLICTNEGSADIHTCLQATCGEGCTLGSDTACP